MYVNLRGNSTVQYSKKIQRLEVGKAKAVETELHLPAQITTSTQWPNAWQLLEALQEVAVMTLNDDGEVSYANALARSIFNLDAPKPKSRKHKHSKTILQNLQDKLKDPVTEFSLQYALDSQVRTLKVFAIDLIHQNVHQQLLYMFDTTSHILSEIKLRETEALLQALIDTSPDYICIKDGNNRWLKANQKLLSLFQIDAKSYAHQSNLELADSIHPVFNNAFQYSEKSDETTWRTQKTYRNEEIIYLPQGTEKTLDVSKIATFNSDASRQHLVMYAQDISEQQFVEKQLQNRSAILDALISCDWLLHSADSWHGVAKTVLQQSCLALRFTRAAILKHLKNTEDKAPHSKLMYHWATSGFSVPVNHLEGINFNDARLSRWKDILQKGNPVFSEISDLPAGERDLLKQHDTTCITIVPLFVENAWWGNIVIERCYDTDKTSSQELGSLMAIGRSLSVAIQREHAKRNLNLAKIAFDSASEGIMIIDTNGSIIGINKGFSDITGYSEEEILGATPLVFQQGSHALWKSLSSEGKWCGEVINHRKNGDQYHEWLTITVVKNHEHQITNYVGVFADITEVKQSQNKLYELVNHDPLTGLPNRRLINELLEHAIKRAEREERKIAILFIDLDRFKAINDSLGHPVGDKLLLEVSRRIKQSIRDSDVVGRLGGDEFIVIMDNLRDTEDATTKAKHILQALQYEFLIDNKELFVSASIGISMYPSDGKDVDSIIKAADIAMYQVKNMGKNNYCHYTKKHSADVLERFNLENQLRRALDREQFEVYYQPQISLQTGKIIGAEALVRWNHPEYGVVSPAKFIPLAEETGIILHIGEWVLTQAALRAKAWVKPYNSLKRIAVNVSGIQIMQSNFADTVYGVLIETDCTPSMLELEITESTVMQNTEHVISTFDRIKSLGVRLAIDDFGTGYSSLSNLKRLPLDKLKIDRSFVRDLPDDMDDAAIASAIYAMANSLGFSVIAEGVETLEQEQFLKNMGCMEAQGYLYSKPVTAEEFLTLLDHNTEKEGNHHVG